LSLAESGREFRQILASLGRCCHTIDSREGYVLELKLTRYVEIRVCTVNKNPRLLSCLQAITCKCCSVLLGELILQVAVHGPEVYLDAVIDGVFLSHGGAKLVAVFHKATEI
jgi:hypothetical protein